MLPYSVNHHELGTRDNIILIGRQALKANYYRVLNPPQTGSLAGAVESQGLVPTRQKDRKKTANRVVERRR